MLLAVVVSFVIFNAQDMAQAWQDLLGMFGGLDVPFATAETVYYLKSYALIFAAGILGATPFVRNCAVKLQKRWQSAWVFRLGVALALLLVSTAYLVDGSFNPFLYFRF